MTTIHTALLSFGMSGKVFHAPFIALHPGFQLLGSWERSTKEIQKFYPGARSYSSLEEVIADPLVDLVIVNTPTYTHYEYAKRALQAGKHVVVEKAFTTTPTEAAELVELARKTNLKLCVYQNRRWDSDFKTVCEVINQGLIGSVVEATFGFLRYAPILSPKAHKEDPGPGAGIMKDLGPHIIDQALFLFGMPKAVFAEIAITRPRSQVDDYFHLVLRYETSRVHLKGGYFYQEPGPSYVLHGEKGSFVKVRGDVQEDQLKAGMKPDHPDYGVESVENQGLLHTLKGDQIIREQRETLNGDYREYYSQVYEAIADGKPIPVSGEDGLAVMKIIDAAFESWKKGRWVEV